MEVSSPIDRFLEDETPSDEITDGTGGAPKDSWVFLGGKQVRAGQMMQSPPHSKRSAALRSQIHPFSFVCVMELGPLPSMAKGERRTRGTDACSSIE